MNSTIIFKDFIEAEIFINFLNEFNIPFKKAWHSKYNKYVFYEYEPSNIEGFNIHIIIEQSKHYLNKLKFIEYLCTNFLKDIKHLEVCYNKELSQCA